MAVDLERGMLGNGEPMRDASSIGNFSPHTSSPNSWRSVSNPPAACCDRGAAPRGPRETESPPRHRVVNKHASAQRYYTREPLLAVRGGCWLLALDVSFYRINLNLRMPRAVWAFVGRDLRMTPDACNTGTVTRYETDHPCLGSESALFRLLSVVDNLLGCFGGVPHVK